MSGRILTVCAVLVLLAGCEAVVGEFEARGCDPSPPASCGDLGDTDAQRVGCCEDGTDMVWFCADGALESQDCAARDQTCDYDPDKEMMGCVE